jgi:hypothetical protein
MIGIRAELIGWDNEGCTESRMEHSHSRSHLRSDTQHAVYGALGQVVT